MSPLRRNILSGRACVLALALSACGGGGSGSSGGPNPIPPAPSPPAPPPPTPGTLNDAEYQSSNSALSAQALTAYQSGATGAGVKVAVIDTGINPNLPEFTGRIDPASQDVAANRGIVDHQGHGSMVSGVVAANRDGTYMQGVAYDATILSLNVYDPAGCKPGNDCFLDEKIDEAIDLARIHGARIINMSFGDEEGMTADVWPAIQRAVDAGIVIVMSAGNGGTADPNSFARQNIQHNGNSGLFIIAGAMDASRTISSFSDRAGSTAAANHYLTALGRGNATVNHLGQHVNVNGTSFSAPTIAGAAALLASAFPNLTGAQIVDILLKSADDAGTTGVDATFGRGILNIAKAFQPSGTASLAGSKTPVSLALNGSTSAPMGDSASQASAGAVILDGYSRAYVMNVARTLREARQESPLHQSIAAVGYRSAGLATGPLAVSITVRSDGPTSRVQSERLRLSGEEGTRARTAAALAITRLSPKTAIAFGFSQSGRTLQKRLAGQSDRAFLVASHPMGRTGFHPRDALSIAARHQLGPIGVTVSAENGRMFEPLGQNSDPRSRYQRTSMSLDAAAGPVRFGLGATRLTESATLLGARFSGLLALAGASTDFVDGEVDVRLGGGWNGGAAIRRGWTLATGGNAARLRTSAWSFDLAKSGLFRRDDVLAFRVTQPLRVDNGGLSLSLPTRYDFASGQATYSRQLLNLAPGGREVDFELGYGRGLFGGFVQIHGFVRNEPGHVESTRRDYGAALRFTAN